jgi:Mg2+-importing ATPase
MTSEKTDRGETVSKDEAKTIESETRVLDNEEILCTPVENVLADLGSSQSGLTSEQAAKHLEIYGPNEVAKQKKRKAIVKFLLNFKNPLVIILLIASLISGASRDWPDTIIILVIILFSVILTFFQESRAEDAAEELRRRVATTVTVMREGKKCEIRLSDVVPGDIVSLSAGDIVPADSRLMSSKDFYVDQSALTGESFPAEKIASAVGPECIPTITEWRNYLFMGTSVVSGSATAAVVKTGGSTEYGKIVRALVARRPETEFEKGLKRFGYLIMQVTFLLVIFVFFINALNNRGLVESLLFSVSLAVGLTPELLPLILTINLSKGALAMSKKGVIVKQLSSIQNFGNMDVLCTDKTGTLTENKVTLLLHIDMEGKDDDKVLLYSFLNSHFQTGLSSPLDEAILSYRTIDVTDYQKIDEVPFDFVRRRVSVVTQHSGERFFITKGAPEEIVKVCSYYELSERISDMSSETRGKIEQKYYDLSSEGYRVLGIAYKKVKEDKMNYSINDESDMVFLGFVAFMDPPKESAKESLQLFKKNQIALKILTGDNELVSRKVCEELGFEIKGVVTGSDIAKMGDDALARVVEESNIFTRVTPSQKDRIISALKGNGHVVGFLGDGINDAPSMRVADVSISVENAVDVAKESADIILLQKDLRVLEEGVLEGRKTFGNTLKYVMMGVSSNFGNMFSVAGASLFPTSILPFLPMQPTQILLNNLLYDMSEATIPTDNVDEEYIERPKRLDMSFVRSFMIYFGPISSIFDFLTFFVMLYVFQANTLSLQGEFQAAWFIESLSTQTLVIFVIRTRLRPFFKSKPSRPLLISSLAVVAFALVLPFTPLGRIFAFLPIPISFLIILALFVAAYLSIVEIVKGLFYRRHAQKLEQIPIPKRAIAYITPTARSLQTVIAVICVRFEGEISIDSLDNDLKGIATYTFDSDQITHGLQSLRHGGLITIDWQKGIIKRQPAIKSYVDKLTKADIWAKTKDDWRATGYLIQTRYGKINPEYQKLVN